MSNTSQEIEENEDSIMGFEDGENFGHFLIEQMLKEVKEMKQLLYAEEYIQNWCQGLSNIITNAEIKAEDADSMKGENTDAAST